MAGDNFIKIGDIKGESADATHKEEIEILSWSWGASQSGSSQSSAGSTAGKVNCQDLTFTKLLDLSSAPMVKAVCAGTSFPAATLTLRKASGDGKGVEYLKILLKNVLISSYSVGGSGGHDSTMETVSLNFGMVTYTYTAQNAAGGAGKSIPVSWNIPANNDKVA
jgi:type VI secretion system secreted protein Hcp